MAPLWISTKGLVLAGAGAILVGFGAQQVLALNNGVAKLPGMLLIYVW